MQKPKLKGPLYNYLGHFKQDKHLRRGHNDSGGYEADESELRQAASYLDRQPNAYKSGDYSDDEWALGRRSELADPDNKSPMSEDQFEGLKRAMRNKAAGGYVDRSDEELMRERSDVYDDEDQDRHLKELLEMHAQKKISAKPSKVADKPSRYKIYKYEGGANFNMSKRRKSR